MPREALQPPAGWTVVTEPTATRAGTVRVEAGINHENIERRYRSLRDWATEAGLALAPTNYGECQYAEYLQVYIWTEFSVTYSTGSLEARNKAVIGRFNCTGCNELIKVGQVYCKTCDRFIACDTCHLSGIRLHGVQGQEGCGSCSYCTAECAGRYCHNRVLTAEGYTKCAVCEPRAACAHCKGMTPLSKLTSFTNAKKVEYKVCPNCVKFVCDECHGHGDDVSDRDIGRKKLHVCQPCAQKHFDKERAQFEKWNDDELPVSGSLLLPGTASRPIRTISIETEFDGNGVEVGRALASQGLLEGPERDRYSTQGTAAGRYPCLLKSDGSVTGGELVTYLVDLDTENHAAALLRMTEVMRGCRELGHAQFTHRAGGHVHIDLHGLTAKDLWAQYSVFNYLQAPLFYIAGAGAEYGHRSLKGSGYSPAGPSGPFGTIGKFATDVLNGRGERWALHYHNFSKAKNACKCGAYITGEWQECTCDLGKATAEWRLWNAEINPRILHAWLALMQAVTSYATDVENFKESDYPAFKWAGTPFDRLPTSSKSLLKERLEWVHRELPLTLHERDSLIYACKKSQLVGLGEKWLDGLIDVVPDNEFGRKKPARNPSTRKKIKFDLVAAAGAVERFAVADGLDLDDVDDDEDGGW